MSEGLVEETAEFIENWQPRKKYHFESRYLDDLKDQMTNKFSVRQPFVPAARRVSVTIENGETLDIGITKKVGQVEETVGIIFKKDLQQLSDLRRLMTQIETDDGEFGSILIVLYGNTASEMKDKLDSFLSMRTSESDIRIISK